MYHVSCITHYHASYIMTIHVSLMYHTHHTHHTSYIILIHVSLILMYHSLIHESYTMYHTPLIHVSYMYHTSLIHVSLTHTCITHSYIYHSYTHHISFFLSSFPSSPSHSPLPHLCQLHCRRPQHTTRPPPIPHKYRRMRIQHIAHILLQHPSHQLAMHLWQFKAIIAHLYAV